jgi:hypothetical protein
MYSVIRKLWLYLSVIYVSALCSRRSGRCIKVGCARTIAYMYPGILVGRFRVWSVSTRWATVSFTPHFTPLSLSSHLMSSHLSQHPKPGTQ